MICLQELQSRKEQLQEQLAAVKASMDEVAQRVTSAQQEHRAAQQAAAERMQALQRVLRRPGLQPPSNAAEAKQLLAQLQQQAAEQQQRWVSRSSMCTRRSAHHWLSAHSLLSLW